jgi:aminopeptidase N
MKQYKETPPGQAKFEVTVSFCEYLAKVNDTTKVKEGVEEVVEFRNMIPETYRGFTDPVLKGALEKVAAAKGGEIAGYIHDAFK